MHRLKCPRIVISGTSSNSGKTFVTMGMARAFERMGLRVSCFKTGPDYIDSDYLARASRRGSGNLDTWMMSKEHILSTVSKAGRDSDIILIEGVRSLYDSASPLGDEGSTSHLAKILDAPVVLVMNVRSLARGAAASALGFMEYDRNVNVEGFILNMVKGPIHHIKATSAIWDRTGKRIYGSIKRDPRLSIEMRHLGLKTTSENERCENDIELSADIVEECVDLEAIYRLACTAPEMEMEGDVNDERTQNDFRISVASDRSFSFLYHENIEKLRSLGAVVDYVSPLSDKQIPEGTSALLLLGGFPEYHAQALGGNGSFLKDLKRAANDGMPIYAECGGLMYLGKRMVDLEKRSWKMSGVLDIESKMHATSQSISYSKLESTRDCIIAKKGSTLKGHEFHYSSVSALSDDTRYAFIVKRGRGIDGRHDGIVEGNVLAQYSHIHMASEEQVAREIRNSAHRYYRS